jgi:pterin-4a-carbinolamine dehydratase
MPPLDDAAVEEGLRHLLGWEGRDNEIVKTFVRADFAHTMVFVKGSPRHKVGSHTVMRW